MSFFAVAGLLAAALDELDVFPDEPLVAEPEDVLEDVDEDAAGAGEAGVAGVAAGSVPPEAAPLGLPGPMNVLTLSQNPTAIPLQEKSFIL